LGEYWGEKKARYANKTPIIIAKGRPSGAKKACTRMILITIGARTTNAKGTKNPDKRRKPQIVSTNFKNGKKYPVAINPELKACRRSGRSGGGGYKFNKPINPKTKKISPSKIRAINGNLAFMKMTFPYKIIWDLEMIILSLHQFDKRQFLLTKP
jgi:hypothetical protein